MPDFTADERDDYEPKRRETNVEFLTRLMEYSRSGPLMQAFIITAIEKYADRCVAAGSRVFDNPMLNGKAWVACAAEVKKAIKDRSL